MANPFANAGLGQFGNEAKYFSTTDSSGSSSDEPSFLGGLLATVVDKSGLKDYLNQSQAPAGGVPAPNTSPLLPIAAGVPDNSYAAYAKKQQPAISTSGYHPLTDAVWAE